MAQLIGFTTLFQICENIGHIFAGLKKTLWKQGTSQWR
jgi:hypothetical protein